MQENQIWAKYREDEGGKQFFSRTWDLRTVWVCQEHSGDLISCFCLFFFFFLLKLHAQGCHHSSSSPRFSSLTPSGLWSSVTMTTVRLSSTWYKPAGPTPTLLTCTASARPSEVNRCDVTWWNRRGGRRLFFFCAATDFYFCFEVEKQTNLHKADRGVRLP